MSGQVKLDGLEHYPKRTFRNRYTLMQSTGPLEMTVPVERRGGRPRPQDDTRRITGDDDRKAWQALKTAYGRAPFFEEMESELHSLYQDGPEMLGGWNRATIQWASSWLGITIPGDVTAQEYSNTEAALVSPMWPSALNQTCTWTHVWQDRNAEIPFERLGILDLLLHLGPESALMIKPILPSEFPRPESRPK